MIQRRQITSSSTATKLPCCTSTSCSDDTGTVGSITSMDPTNSSKNLSNNCIMITYGGNSESNNTRNVDVSKNSYVSTTILQYTNDTMKPTVWRFLITSFVLFCTILVTKFASHDFLHRRELLYFGDLQIWQSTLTSLQTKVNQGKEDEYAKWESIISKDIWKYDRNRKVNLNANVSAGEPIAIIAYAVSLTHCGDWQSSPAGLIDAAIILRHSIHQTSIRNNTSSKYDYKMYAIVHPQAMECSKSLRDIDYEILVRDTPVNISDISAHHLRNNIQKDGCCGEKELIKLYAYTIIDHPIVVHIDMDHIVQKPFDHLYDAMIFPKNTTIGLEARQKIQMEQQPNNPLSKRETMERVDAFITRDYASSSYGRKALFQGGLLIIRPSIAIFEAIKNVILTATYVDGPANTNGWGGKGYGSFTGAMTVQGVLAYIYDTILPNNVIELNQCRYNHMGCRDFILTPFPEGCHNGSKVCEDCRTTDINLIHSLHYTVCPKPWLCTDPITPKHLIDNLSIPMIDWGHCLVMQDIWHTLRSNFEQQLFTLTSDNVSKKKIQSGLYNNHMYHGHCNNSGLDQYISLTQMNPQTFRRIPDLYI